MNPDTITKKKALIILLDMFHSIERNWSEVRTRQELIIKFKNTLQDFDNVSGLDIPYLTRLHIHINENITLPHLCGLIVPIEREHERSNITDEDFIITTCDADRKVQASKMPVTVVLDNIRSAFNVGGIFRTSDCIGIENIYMCGYSATPENKKVAQSSMGSESFTKWKQLTKIEHATAELKAKGIPIIAMETVEGQPSYCDIEYPFPCAIILGNERFGLSQSIIASADYIATIPTYGHKNSLNVVSAFTVCGYEVRRQWEASKGRISV